MLPCETVTLTAMPVLAGTWMPRWAEMGKSSDTPGMRLPSMREPTVPLCCMNQSQAVT